MKSLFTKSRNLFSALEENLFADLIKNNMSFSAENSMKKLFFSFQAL